VLVSAFARRERRKRVDDAMNVCPVLISLPAFAGGIYMICGGLFNWDFFMKHYRSGAEIMGRRAARIAWIIMGAIFAAIGVRIMIQ
jgi:hypothetical protein